MLRAISSDATTIDGPIEAVQPPRHFPLNFTRQFGVQNAPSYYSSTTRRNLSKLPYFPSSLCCETLLSRRRRCEVDQRKLRQALGKTELAENGKPNIQSSLHECFFMHDIDTPHCTVFFRTGALPLTTTAPHPLQQRRTWDRRGRGQHQRWGISVQTRRSNSFKVPCSMDCYL